MSISVKIGTRTYEFENKFDAYIAIDKYNEWYIDNDELEHWMEIEQIEFFRDYSW